MLAVHRIFQMIFGIIVSFLLLYFLITYSGNYSKMQQDAQRAEILKAFVHDVRDVYLAGIPINFTYFSRYDFSSCFVSPREKDIPEIKCESGVSGIPIETPVIFYPGKKVYIGRDTLDYGWWVSGFAEAIPDTTFAFNPLEGTDEAWNVAENIVNHLPDTSDEWSVVKVQFAFCDGNEILYPCGGRVCSKADFLTILQAEHSGVSLQKCTANLRKDVRLVTIAQFCNNYLIDSGVCIAPPNSKGVGNAYVAGSAETYVWKDPLDLVALSVGGSEKDEFGKTWAEKIFEYKNSVLTERLSFAAEVMSKRAVLLSGRVPQETGCGDVYIQLAQVLEGVSGKDYKNLVQMWELNDRLNKAKELYDNLVNLGCERSGSEYGV